MKIELEDEAPLHSARALNAPARLSAPKLSWREQRELRRRRRIWFEEILGWILVPVILFGCYWMVNLALTAIGTSPAAIMEGVEALLANL